VIVAPIKPLSSIDDATSAKVLEGKVFALAPLPGVPNLGDCYIDFRSLTAIDREAALAAVRLASVTPEAERFLQARVVAFFTRLTLPPPSEAHTA